MTKDEKLEMNKEKLKALQLTMDKIEKSYGKGSIMRLGDRAVDEVAAISSGSIALDVALGIGGYPKGRVIEIFGPESSGKTTLAIHAIAEAQKAGGIAAIQMFLVLRSQYVNMAAISVAIEPSTQSTKPKGDHKIFDIRQPIVRPGIASTQKKGVMVSASAILS